MSDYISREDALSYLPQYPLNYSKEQVKAFLDGYRQHCEQVSGCEAIDMVKREHGEWNWVSVTDRLPEKYERVLCINGHCFYMVGFLRYVSFVEGHDYIGEDDYRYMSNVTHWMPLPKPPEDGDG